MMSVPSPSRRAHPPHASTTASLRQRHRAMVLTEILLARQTTRAELVALTGLSVASITNMVADLMAEGLVEEVGQRASGGGRPVALLEPLASGAYVLGADVGERGVAVELFDLTMTVIDRVEIEADETEPVSSIVVDIDTAVSTLKARHQDKWAKVVGLGLALPGPVETEADGSQVLYAESLGWPPVPVSELAGSHLTVFADNGAKAQARAEMWFGAARGADHALVPLLGRGVGLGVISEGGLLQGSRSSASEWGHVPIRPEGSVCRCGRRGCIEAYIGADAILDAWRARGGTAQGSGWEAMTALIAADGDGDAQAGAVIDDVILVLGAGLGGLVNLHNPERIVLGGWVGMLLMDHYAERIASSLVEHAMRRPGSQVTLVPAAFGGDSVALGAAILALEALIHGTP